MEYLENHLDSFAGKDGKLLGWRNPSKSLRPGSAEPVLTRMVHHPGRHSSLPSEGS